MVITSRAATERLKPPFGAKVSLSLPEIHAQPGDGIEGFANAAACVVPGVLETCPPVKAVVPFLRPIPKGVVVEMRAERTLQGETRFVFDAMTPIEFREMTVPQELYA